MVGREVQDRQGDAVQTDKRALSWVVCAGGPDVLQNTATHHLGTIPSPHPRLKVVLVLIKFLIKRLFGLKGSFCSCSGGLSVIKNVS